MDCRAEIVLPLRNTQHCATFQLGSSEKGWHSFSAGSALVNLRRFGDATSADVIATELHVALWRQQTREKCLWTSLNHAGE